MKKQKKNRFPFRLLTFAGVLIGIVLLLCVLDPSILQTEYPDRLAVRYIDVGQGDAALISLPTGETMLIDTGTNDSETALLAALARYHVKKLDWAVFTHPHEDHIGGADAVLSRYRIDNILMPEADTESSTADRLFSAVEQENAVVFISRTGDSYQIGEASFTVLSSPEVPDDSVNEQSIVLRFDYLETSFLFTADAGADAEEAMLTAFPPEALKADVLKLGHHGSSTGTTDAFLDAVSPSFAVISCGKHNEYGHPHRETLQKLDTRRIPVYRTDTDGTVSVFSDGKQLLFRTEYSAKQ